MSILRTVPVIGICAKLFCATAVASPILLDPATLHIGPGANTACATGGCPIFIGGALNGEVNNFGPAELDIYQNQANASGLDSPVLLILGVPNNSATLGAGNVKDASLYAPYPDLLSPTVVPVAFGTTSFGISTPSGFAGLMNSSDVYSFLGIKGADKSNSFVNWSAADLRMMGTSVSDFGIYVYSLETPNFKGNDLIDVSLQDIPEGTFAVGYGQNSKYLFDTPFTQAGLEDQPVLPIPEPNGALLFGTGLAALGLIRRHKRGAL